MNTAHSTFLTKTTKQSTEPLPEKENVTITHHFVGRGKDLLMPAEPIPSVSETINEYIKDRFSRINQ